MSASETGGADVSDRRAGEGAGVGEDAAPSGAHGRARPQVQSRGGRRGVKETRGLRAVAGWAGGVPRKKTRREGRLLLRAVGQQTDMVGKGKEKKKKKGKNKIKSKARAEGVVIHLR